MVEADGCFAKFFVFIWDTYMKACDVGFGFRGVGGGLFEPEEGGFARGVMGEDGLSCFGVKGEGHGVAPALCGFFGAEDGDECFEQGARDVVGRR